MTELENKLVERILEKMDLEKLIEKIGYDVLTDKIAEKAAELIVKKEYPDAPTGPIAPIIPGNPIKPSTPWELPITVMYGVTPTEFKPTTTYDSSGTTATTEYYKEETGKEEK